MRFFPLTPTPHNLKEDVDCEWLTYDIGCPYHTSVPTIHDCGSVSASTHLTGPWHALHAPECVVCVCHASSLTRMWYAQVWFQAVRSISIPYCSAGVPRLFMEHPQVVLRCVSHTRVLQISEVWRSVASYRTTWHMRWKQKTHWAYCFAIITKLSLWERPQAVSTILMGKYGERVDRLNGTESWDIVDIHYITFKCTMWWLNICIWQSFCEFSEIPHFVDWDSSSNWPNSGACIHWWSWVSRNFKSLYPLTFRIF